jgi:hypothetical protein
MALRNWYEVPGGDRSMYVMPAQTTAVYRLTGPDIDQLTGNTFASVRSIATTSYTAPTWIGNTGDVLCSVHDATGTIATFNMLVPAGAVSENAGDPGDNSCGFMDRTQPFLYVTGNNCMIGSSVGNASAGNAVSSTNNVIVFGIGMIKQDASGPILMDATNGSTASGVYQNGDNCTGALTYYDLQQINLGNPVQHMVGVTLGLNCFSNAVIWPLLIGDVAGTGNIPEGAVIMIPQDVALPSGASAEFEALFNLFQQQGGLFNNTTSTDQIAIQAQPMDSATAALVARLDGAFIEVVPYLRLLEYTSGMAGAQYSVATLKGRIAGAPYSDAFPAPPLLDFSSVGGSPVLPTTFGAWQGANGLGTLEPVSSVIWENTIGDTISPAAVQSQVTAAQNVVASITSALAAISTSVGQLP